MRTLAMPKAAASWLLTSLSEGIVSLTFSEQTSPTSRSPGRDCIAPLVRRLGSKDPERGTRHEMALKVEGVVNGGVHAEKTLSGASRLEPLHFALSPAHRLMRVFGSIVLCPLPGCTELTDEVVAG
jgi:hypothetical protein